VPTCSSSEAYSESVPDALNTPVSPPRSPCTPRTPRTSSTVAPRSGYRAMHDPTPRAQGVRRTAVRSGTPLLRFRWPRVSNLLSCDSRSQYGPLSSC
jgi:hypothetical protein